MAQVANVRSQLFNRRMFIMRKEGEELPDSREASGLRAKLRCERLHVETGPTTTRVTAACSVTNTGRNRWLPSSAGIGAVLLGLRTRHGRRPSADHGRVRLPGDRMLDPGEQVVVELGRRDRTPRAGSDPVWLELDLVSEGISWFAEVHGHPMDDSTASVRSLKLSQIDSAEVERRDARGSVRRRAVTCVGELLRRPAAVACDIAGGSPART